MKINLFDKILHFLINFFGIIVLVDYINIILAISIMAGVSILKEMYDKYKKNPTGFSWWDLLADFTGLGLGVFVRLTG